ncbi:PREDICTED: uncharacterized protein LOC104987282, partial [Bison bison bison]|uniref:Uncharacterized protein LOC104987282 n=1 Tax=Bison bison bison TaxID=43346 RepID=A0A6P3HAW5_BISBB
MTSHACFLSSEPMQEGRPAQRPSQLPPARLWEELRFQGSRTRPRSAAPVPFSRFTIQMLEQSLREEDLRARHQAALLRLREKALEEKTRTELAWLEHQRGYLNSIGSYAALVALAEKQHQALSYLERELRGIRYLRTLHLSSHRERKLLLQQQKDIVSVQRSAALLQQELQDRTRLPQSSSPEVKARREEGTETSPQQPEGPGQGSSHAWHTPGSPLGQYPQRSESPPVPHLLSEPQDGTPPPAASAADGHPCPPTLAWDKDSPAVAGRPDARGQPPESHGRTSQGSPWRMSRNPRVPWNSVWEARGVLRGLCKETCWASEGEEGEEGLGAWHWGPRGTVGPGRLWDWSLKTEGQEDWSVCETLPRRPALLALQSQGGSLVSLCRAFCRRPPWTQDGHQAQPFLYATPQKALSPLCPLGGTAP